MKRYINKVKSLVLLATVSFGFASCGDFLEIEPKTFVSEDNFWNEKTDIDQMVAGVYVKMQSSAFIERLVVWGEVRSDNIVEGLNASNQTNLYRTLKENLLSTNSYTDWTQFYSVINACNNIIEMAPVVSEKDPVYTASDVLATQAEMSCIRDLCYFYLVRAFKDVPYYTYAINSEDDVAPIPATSGDSIVGCLIEDLEGVASNALKAYPKDNSNVYNSTRNRITQNAIYSLLADLCLWDGQYQKCVDYAQRVIDAKYYEYMEDYSNSTSNTNGSLALFRHPDDRFSKGFPLYPCFSGNTYGNDFTQVFGENQNSFESIFELAFTYDGNSSNYISNSSLGSLYGEHSSGGNEGEGYLGVNDNIISDIANSQTGSIFNNRYDVRYYANLYNPDFKNNEFTKGYASKYVNTGANITTASGSTLPFTVMFDNTINTNRNWIFYRLTDVMLLQAQALIELGSEINEYDEEGNAKSTTLDDNLTRAFYIIWAVNRRSVMTNSTSASSGYELDMTSYQTKAQLEDLAMKERRRELMFEGKRWFDMLRFCHRDGNTDYIKSHVSAKGSSGSTSSLFTNYESLYWPYSKTEVKNNSALSQKPYYGNDDDEDNYKSTK